MIDTSTQLGRSHAALMKILMDAPELRDGQQLDAILAILADRRATALTDLSPTEQASLIAGRTRELLPSVDRLGELLASARTEGRRLTVKFGIDPTAADIHLGHAVPMIVAGRLQRMGHRVVFIVGDIIAKIGDPTGRVADRPPLTDDDIRRNMASYRQQAAPFFDFDRAEFRNNSEWLAECTLPQLIGVLEQIPLSSALQREDFRNRLGAGSGLTMAELFYSVVMALDSVAVAADIELGGLDQLLNMQMCRRVMENHGQTPQIVVATGLIEGTDGTGAKMSKSKGNYIGLAFEATDVHGKLMSVPDRLLPDYLRALTELLDPEIAVIANMMADRRIHPMGVKTLLASDLTGAIHGADAATAARTGFRAQFSRKRFSDVVDVAVIDRSEHAGTTIAQLFVEVTGQVPSVNRVRRTARDGGLRLVAEMSSGERESVSLNEDMRG
ncbi:tyrosine--tRNA ligase [Nocardia sp. NPDC052254]|uniref:tyrosine--tRNA ligase n=1 Tax=Nocardia sp. NPDC052254 TaxID=3155681 RepID=UPI00341EA0EA